MLSFDIQSVKKEIYEFTSVLDGSKQSCNIYIDRAGSVYYIGFENTKKCNVINSIEQIAQDMVIKYNENSHKPTEDYFFFFKWDPLCKDNGIEQVEFTWEGPIPSTPIKTQKFCEYKKNPFFS